MDSCDCADVASRINFSALLGWWRARLGDLPAAWDHVSACLELCEMAEPTTYMTLFGYTTAPEILLRLMLASSSSDILDQLQLSQTRLLSLLDQSLVLLAKYADVVRCAAPRLALWRGVVAHVAGKKKEADKQLKEAHQLALSMQMLYEQALALLYRGALAGAKDGAALGKQAAEIFTSISVSWTVQPPFIDPARFVQKKSK